MTDTEQRLPGSAEPKARYWKVTARGASGPNKLHVHAPNRDKALQEAARFLAGGMVAVKISRGPVDHECRNARLNFDTREWECVKCGKAVQP